jgi:outer membrane protein OmpA-like peptidoglycan-associated protein
MKSKTLILFTIIITLQSVFLSGQNDTIRLYFQINEWHTNEDHVATISKVFSGKKIESVAIFGYTDFLGNSDHNQTLSEKRCQSVKKLLISHGIDSLTITSAAGMGVHPESRPEKRTQQNDRGIADHRKTEIIAIYSEPQQLQSLININELEVGQVIELENIYFVGNEAIILPQSYGTLDALFHVMNENPGVRIRIEGHVNAPGQPPDIYYDNKLAQRRAKAIYDELVMRSIKPERMEHTGYGNTRMVYPNAISEQEQAKNRRVEIIILEK